jgi:hypothetical protein
MYGKKSLLLLLLLGGGFSAFVAALFLLVVDLVEAPVESSDDCTSEDEEIDEFGAFRKVLEGQAQELHLVSFVASLFLLLGLLLLLADLHLLVELLGEFDDGFLVLGDFEVAGDVVVVDVGEQVEQVGGVEAVVLHVELSG